MILEPIYRKWISIQHGYTYYLSVINSQAKTDTENHSRSHLVEHQERSAFVVNRLDYISCNFTRSSLSLSHSTPPKPTHITLKDRFQ